MALRMTIFWGGLIVYAECHPEFIPRGNRRPLYSAVSNLTLKAWVARERALSQHGVDLNTMKVPQFIVQLRDHKSIRSPIPRNPWEIPQGQHIESEKAPIAAAMPAVQPVPASGPGMQPPLEAPPVNDFDWSLMSDTPMDDPGPVDWAQWDRLLQDFDLPNEATFVI